MANAVKQQQDTSTTLNKAAGDYIAKIAWTIESNKRLTTPGRFSRLESHVNPNPTYQPSALRHHMSLQLIEVVYKDLEKSEPLLYPILVHKASVLKRRWVYLPYEMEDDGSYKVMFVVTEVDSDAILFQRSKVFHRGWPNESAQPRIAVAGENIFEFLTTQLIDCNEVF